MDGHTSFQKLTSTAPSHLLHIESQTKHMDNLGVVSCTTQVPIKFLCAAHIRASHMMCLVKVHRTPLSQRIKPPTACCMCLQVSQRPAQGTQQWVPQAQAPPAQPQWGAQQPPQPSQGSWPQQPHQQQSGYGAQHNDQTGLFPPAPAYGAVSQGQGQGGAAAYPGHGPPQVFTPQAPAAAPAGPPPPPSHVSLRCIVMWFPLTGTCFCAS